MRSFADGALQNCKDHVPNAASRALSPGVPSAFGARAVVRMGGGLRVRVPEGEGQGRGHR